MPSFSISWQMHAKDGASGCLFDSLLYLLRGGGADSGIPLAIDQVYVLWMAARCSEQTQWNMKRDSGG